MGVRTKRDPIHFGDEVESINPFGRELIDPQKFYNVLNDWIYPAPQHVSIEWLPYCEAGEAGLMVIEVPPQRLESRPFLIRRVCDAGKRIEIVFGYTERRGEETEHWSVEKIQAYLRDGSHYNELIDLRYEEIGMRLEKIEVLLTENRREVAQTQTAELLGARISDALSEVQLSQNSLPAFVLASIPIENVVIRGLLETKNAEVVKLLRNPPELRESGFDLYIDDQPRIIKGDLRRVAHKGHKGLEVWKDGTLIFVARGDADFLCWGKATSNSGQLIINQLAMIEATYLFVELSRQVYQHAETIVENVCYSLGLLNAKKGSQPIGLIPGPINTLGWRFGEGVRVAPQTNVLLTIETKNMLPTGVIAHQILGRLYNWFSIETDQIPYVVNVDGQPSISADKIREAGQS